MSFFNIAMLAGLVAVAIPPIIHLLNRRRYDIVDWGAMQFLEISEVTRRRILIEEILLMALRMGLIAILVFALARPYTEGSIVDLGGRPNRDVVLIIDGSASMDFKKGEESTFEKAQKWATTFVEGLKPGDGVAIVVARKQPISWVPKLVVDRKYLGKMIQTLPRPGGGADLPEAVRKAHAILDSSERGLRDIIVLGDGQRYGWTDATSEAGWKNLRSEREVTSGSPRLWNVNLDPERAADVANWSLAPLSATRAVVAVNERVRFRTAILLSGSAKYAQPHAFHGQINGNKVDLEDETGKPFTLPSEQSWKGGQLALDFWVRAPAKPGSHLFSLFIEPDPPRGKQATNYVVKDHLAVDNRRDFAVEVVKALPVLIVHGDGGAESKLVGKHLLADALDPHRKDSSPVCHVLEEPYSTFQPDLIRATPDKPTDRPNEMGAEQAELAAITAIDLDKATIKWFATKERELEVPGTARITINGKKAELKDLRQRMRARVRYQENRVEEIAAERRLPRVLILRNVPKLNVEQQRAVEAFLQGGGGVLVALGDQVETKVYNQEFHRDGAGWLPARLERVLGDEDPTVKPAGPLTEAFYHPALELFRKEGDAGLNKAYFARWWGLAPPENATQGTTVARLDRNESPLLIEGRRGEGRIFVCAVPLDNSWRTNLVDLTGFVPLAHELVYYLADTRAAEYNLSPGRPLHYLVPRDTTLEGITLKSPTDADAKPLVLDGQDNEQTYRAELTPKAEGSLLVHEGMFEAGVWKLTTSAGEVVHYVVQPDAGEADLAPVNDEDRERVNKTLRGALEDADLKQAAQFSEQNDAQQLLASMAKVNQKTEFWWWFLLGVVLMLCSEVWLTRHIVKNRA